MPEVTPTHRIYYTDARCANFDAVVQAIDDEGRRIVLDRTAFYPTSGGQPHDLGTLAGIAVNDVIDEDGRIAHQLARPFPGRVGQRVTGEIHWPRRYDHMQQHTGQHLLSAVLADLFGWATTSVHFGPLSSTIDLATESVEPEQLRDAELAVNRIITEARPVSVSFEDAEVVADLRKASSRSGTLRIITIADTDRSACGGTHVSSTAELAPLFIRKVERAKRAVRVEFVCGQRARHRARADYESLTAAGRLLTVSADEVPGAVELLQGQLRDATSARRRLEDEVTAVRAQELYDAAVPDQSGRRTIIVDRQSGGLDELRALAPALSRLNGAWFLGISRNPPAVVLAAAADTGVDAGQTLRAALAQAGARGGGSPRVAQGTVADPAELDRIIEALHHS